MDTLAAAMEAFTAPETTEPAAAAAAVHQPEEYGGQPSGDGEGSGFWPSLPVPADGVQAEAKAGEAAPVVEAPADPLEALKDNPRVQELIQAETGYKGAVEEAGKYGINIPDASTMRNVVADGAALNAVLEGRAPATMLLDNLVQYWPKDVSARMLGEVKAWIAKHEGQPAPAPANGQAPANQYEKELKEIKDKIAARETQEANAQRETVRQNAVKTLESEVLKLCGNDADEAKYWASQVASQLGRDPNALRELESGKTAPIEKILTQLRNAELQRLKKHNDKLIAGKAERDKKLPQSPAGGSPPAPGVKKPDWKDSDSRQAAALDIFRNG